MGSVRYGFWLTACVANIIIPPSSTFSEHTDELPTFGFFKFNIKWQPETRKTFCILWISGIKSRWHLYNVLLVNRPRLNHPRSHRKGCLDSLMRTSFSSQRWCEEYSVLSLVPVTLLWLRQMPVKTNWSRKLNIKYMDIASTDDMASRPCHDHGNGVADTEFWKSPYILFYVTGRMVEG